MLTADLDYDLPPDRIAVDPADPRDDARLMVVHRATGRVEHRRVRDLPEFLVPGDLMVVNQSKVLPAWFTGVRAATGGRVQGLYLSHVTGTAETWRVLLESRGTLTPGEVITLDGRASLVLVERIERGEWSATLRSDASSLAVLARVGTPPLPPYIRKARAALQLPPVAPDDTHRYNTIYAAAPGSVAAPTAGLHFTPDLLAALDARGVVRAAVTLHVGLGTFAPVDAEQLEEHRLHAEWTATPRATLDALTHARRDRRRIVAVGTTTVRTLESLPDPLPPTGDHAADTSLMILPGFTFRYTDVLMTNFHLPRSSLMALVAALPGVGAANLLAWYRLAIDHGYRFYSYGDAMLLL